MINYSNKKIDRIEMTVGELRTLMKGFEKANKSKKIAIIRGIDNLGGEYIEISRVID